MKTAKSGIGKSLAASIAIVLIAVSAGAVYYYTTLPGSSSTTSTTTTGPSIDPHPNQLVYDSLGGGPQFVDPAIDYETAGGQVIQNVNEQLLFFKGANASELVPWLAESYTTSADGTTYTFQLRQGIQFSDGTPFNASAVYFSIMRAIIIDDPSGPVWGLSQILRGAYNYSVGYGGSGDYSQADVDSLVAAAPVTIDGPYTVSFHLMSAYAPFPYVLAWSAAAVVSPSAYIAHWVPPTNSSTGVLPANAGNDGFPLGGATAGDYEDAENQWQMSHTVGTGPYILQSWDQSTGDVTLVKNPNYWGGPDGSIQPTIQTVLIKNVDDPNTRELDLKAGTADLANIPIATGQIFDFVDQSTWNSTHTIVNTFPGVSVYGPFPQLETDFVGFNQMRMDSSGNLLAFQPFQNPLVREAFAYAFDTVTYVNQVQKGFNPIATQVIPPGMLGYDSSIQPVTFDLQQAKTLLIQAGPSAGFGPDNPQTIDVYYNTGNAARQNVAIMLGTNLNLIANETGLHVTINVLPWAQILTGIRHHTVDVWNLGWIVDYVDPDDFLIPFVDGNAGTYAIWSGFNNATLNAMVSEQATTLNQTQRLQIIGDIQQQVNNQHLYIWTMNGVALNIARTWVQEVPNAYITSNIGTTYLTSLYGPYFASIQAIT